MKNRKANLIRKTNETNIFVEVNIDGVGKYNINTPIPFMSHMLEQLSKHSLIDINIQCEGDLEIDAHHTIEDLGWALGEVINNALKDKKGINRYFSINLPMDETLTRCAIDVCGRPWLVWKVIITNAKIGKIDSDIFREFFQSFSQASKTTIHIENIYGSNGHHIIESCFKSLAISLRNSLIINPHNINNVPSTKGTIS